MLTTVISGRKCSVLLKNQDRVSLWQKMLLGSSAWHSTRCFLTWKAKATPRGRLYFQLVPSTPSTDETGFGFWPTPNVSDKKGTARDVSHDVKRGYLRGMVRLWPTPAAHEARLGYQDRSRGKKGSQKSLTTEVIDDMGGRTSTTGQLSPLWTEWLMGYPTDHTALKDLETPSSPPSATKS